MVTLAFFFFILSYAFYLSFKLNALIIVKVQSNFEFTTHYSPSHFTIPNVLAKSGCICVPPYTINVSLGRE